MKLPLCLLPSSALVGLVLLCLGASGHKQTEAWYVEQYQKTHGGEIEVRMPDEATRCDLVTETHAIEFDFASNWAESIGQSLYYAFQTNKKAGIIIITEDVDKDIKYWFRLQSVIKANDLKIDAWRYAWVDGKLKRLEN